MANSLAKDANFGSFWTEEINCSSAARLCVKAHKETRSKVKSVRGKRPHRSGSRGNLKKETLRCSELCLQSAAAQQSGILDSNCTPVRSKEQSLHGQEKNSDLPLPQSSTVTVQVRAGGSSSAFTAKASFPCCDMRVRVCGGEREIHCEIVAELPDPSRKWTVRRAEMNSAREGHAGALPRAAKLTRRNAKHSFIYLQRIDQTLK